MKKTVSLIHSSNGCLKWLDGIGFFPANPDGVYNREYWDKYVGYARTPRGQNITSFRVALVRKWAGWQPQAVDVGIGCGQFVMAMNCFGYDVNPVGVTWLKANHRWINPWVQPCNVLTFWDSLEHIRNPVKLLANARRWIFVSMPIFSGMDHVAASKHFRPDEHYWYFSEDGLIRFMRKRGFTCREVRWEETYLGRDDIGTFVFERVRG